MGAFLREARAINTWSATCREMRHAEHVDSVGTTDSQIEAMPFQDCVRGFQCFVSTFAESGIILKHVVVECIDIV